MKKLIITQEQAQNLSDELATLTFEFKKDENIECIYISSYDEYLEHASGPTYGKMIKENFIDFHIVYNNFVDYKKIDEYNLLYQSTAIEKFGIKIHINADDSYFYSIMHSNLAGTLSNRAENELYNSVILYDKNGKFQKLKDSTEVLKKRYITPWVFVRDERIELNISSLDNTSYLKFDFQSIIQEETGKMITKSNIHS